MEKTRLEDSMQLPLKAPFPEPGNRSSFWNDYKNKRFGYIVKRYGGTGVVHKVKNILGKIKRKLIK